MAFNNKHTVKEGRETISYATGLTGHVEYTMYSDGSQDVKDYPGLGHRLFDSKLYQDINGMALLIGSGRMVLNGR
ncbi:MAG: hypothetical protein KKA79_01645 [Nanoarchaeota archaeon]|nr:hypothetical protein [Nanoarchaeota archaeon]MCG2718447.1 hypothetical protein [Nanoarchaeota archaeon]